MITKLENDLIEVLADGTGAQLTSIKGKKDNIEYLWIADPKCWGRHAPILFPIVGMVKDNKYRIGNMEYNLEKHGFAKEQEFEVILEDLNMLEGVNSLEDVNMLENTNMLQDVKQVIYRLSDNEETLKKYPFHFQLDVVYSLVSNKLNVTYKIVNTDNTDIFFSIGAHPGFNCPLLESEAIEDYYLEFRENETASIQFIDLQTGLLTRGSELYLNNEKIINLTKDLFKNDALVFKNLKSKEISIKNHKNNKKVTVSIEGFPYLGIWAKPNGAPFVCIEPWFGHADFTDFNGDFREKSGIIKLETGKEFSCSYTITIEQ
jgi:galactose mutarotase-like enzyme